MRIVDRLEEVHVDQHHRHIALLLARLLQHQRQVAVEIAAVVEAGEFVGHGQRQGIGDALAQLHGIALAADLGANAGRELVALDRPHDEVVDPEIEPAHHARPVGTRRRSG